MQLSTRRFPPIHGKDPGPLMAALDLLKAQRVDLLASQDRLRFRLEPPRLGAKPELCLEAWRDDAEPLRLFPTDKALDQIADKTGIPVKYFQRCGTDLPPLLLENVNGWLRESPKENRLLRGQRQADGAIALRAFLSDRYRILDHADLALKALETAVDAMHEASLPPPEVFGWDLSETSMDLLLCAPGLTADLGKEHGSGAADRADGEAMGHDFTGPQGRAGTDGGDLVFAAVRLRNSETGGGGLQVRPTAMRRVCSNRLMLGFDMAQIHLGRTLTEELLASPETRTTENALVWMKVRDAVKGTFSRPKFEELVGLIRATKGQPIIPAVAAVDLIVKNESLSDRRRDAILAAYKREADPARDTLFDIVQAVTASAHGEREADPDGAYELEELGSRLMAKPPARLLLGV